MQRQVEAAVSAVRSEMARSGRWRVAALGVGAIVLAATTGAAVWVSTRPDPPRVSRLTLTTSGAAALTLSGLERDLAITPDGTRLVHRGPNQLLVRALDQLEPIVLGGLGGVRSVFVSPDGQSVGLFDDSLALKRVAIAGGPAATLAPADGLRPSRRHLGRRRRHNLRHELGVHRPPARLLCGRYAHRAQQT